MFKIVAVGEEDFIIGFRVIGAELVSIKSSEELDGILEKLCQDTTISLILITETMAKDCMEIITGYRKRSTAILLLIPTHTDKHNLSLKEMQIGVEKAAGIDLMK